MHKQKSGAKFFEHSIPKHFASKYPKFAKIAKTIESDEEISQLWVCCNVMAIERLKINDHGTGHIRMVLKNALAIFELLMKAGITPNMVKDYDMTEEDALIVILLAVALHDIGHVIARRNHGTYSLALCRNIIYRILEPHYSLRDLTTMYAEALHAMYSHMSESEVTTIEGGIVRVADALDIKEGRAQEALKAGKVDIHSLSAISIRNVNIMKGKHHPVHVAIEMSDTAGIFQVDSLLKVKLKGSTIGQYVSVYARILGDNDNPIKEYRINI
jgi:metal-dependent HD superfamily phosphatase/phosphodiesterase